MGPRSLLRQKFLLIRTAETSGKSDQKNQGEINSLSPISIKLNEYNICHVVQEAVWQHRRSEAYEGADFPRQNLTSKVVNITIEI